eukprot:gene9865-6937_t
MYVCVCVCLSVYSLRDTSLSIRLARPSPHFTTYFSGGNAACRIRADLDPSVATGKKLDLASKADAFTFRSLASLISLVCYAVHTTRLNPSWLFLPMRMYRAIFHIISRTSRWDDRVTLG